MRFSSTISLLTLLSIVSAAPLQARGESSDSLKEAVDYTIGSVTGTGSSNEAGDGNSASASGNGNGNTGAAASASNFLNGAAAEGNGIGNDNDGNSAISLKRRTESSAWGANPETSTDEIIGSVVDTGSGNLAGVGNTASAGDNGNGNTGATASAGNFLNGASATDNGIGNGNDDNSAISLRKRVAALEQALTQMQKRQTCESSTIGSVVSTAASDVAGSADSASAINSGNSNTGSSASATNFLNDASASNNGVANDNDDNTLVNIDPTINL